MKSVYGQNSDQKGQEELETEVITMKVCVYVIHIASLLFMQNENIVLGAMVLERSSICFISSDRRCIRKLVCATHCLSSTCLVCMYMEVAGHLFMGPQSLKLHNCVNYEYNRAKGWDEFTNILSSLKLAP